MRRQETPSVRPNTTVVSTGSGRQQRWYVAQPSLAGLLASGPYRSETEATAAADRPRRALAR
jgi:hypothetical protein